MIKNISYIWHFLLFCLINLSAATLTAANSSKDFTVVIDAGHGGNDPGALGRRGKEKEINLEVALKLGKYIEKGCKDTRVIYTRKRDVFIPLHKRAEIANNAKADLFISIHTNSLAKRTTRVSGAETYTLGLHRTKENLEVAKKENAVILIEDNYKQQYAGFNPNSSESYIIFEFMQDKNLSQSVSFASAIQKEFKNSKRVDRGVHQAGFLVLRATSMPSVLVELGYISNPNEEAYLLSEKGTTTLARAIYQAFLTYKEQSDTGQSTTRNMVQTTRYTSANTDASEMTETPSKSKSSKERDSLKKQPEPRNARANERSASTGQKPVFKIQILTSQKLLSTKSSRFKGLSPVEHYKENGIYKYTFGSDTNYNKIRRLKKSHTDGRFKDAFIIAFKNGKKMNVNEAIREFKNNR